MNTLVVANCALCPFAAKVVDPTAGMLVCRVAAPFMVVANSSGRESPPDNCPLRKASVTVKLLEDADE